MGWNTLDFSNLLIAGTGKVEKERKDCSQKKRNNKFFGSNSFSGNVKSDEFIHNSRYATTPFYSQDTNLQKYLKPSCIERAANRQPLNSLPESKNACDINDVVKSFLTVLYIKDPYTKTHSKAVKDYSDALARKLNLSNQHIKLINMAAIFHDIGKIGVPEYILHKKSKLSDDENEIIKKHPENGSKILELIPAFDGTVSDMVKQHHENWDGSGYPDGVKEKNISLGARIIAIADSYHAMTSDRPYRKGLPTKEALRRLREGAGSQWDPVLVVKFFNLINARR